MFLFIFALAYLPISQYYPATPLRVCIDLSDVKPHTSYCATAAQLLSHEWDNSTVIPYDAPYVPLPPAQCKA
jgi:hypothetical protein